MTACIMTPQQFYHLGLELAGFKATITNNQTGRKRFASWFSSTPEAKSRAANKQELFPRHFC